MPNNPPPRDGLGRRVPIRLEKVFAGREKLIAWAGALGQLEMRLIWLADASYGEEIDQSVFNRDLERIRNTVLAAIPFAPCECLGIEECGLCNSKGWMTAKQWNLRTSTLVW
uniref:Uncharacterized protein n=1 Tax=viral metagenome TaxID=1070528 RepID=A0A6H1ZMZ3_9ZZZZ